MNLGLSTFAFLQHRLSSGLLDAVRVGGAGTIEIYAARHHFDYTDRSAVRELAAWFRSNNVIATLHQPLYSGTHWSRHVAPGINLIDAEKGRRIEAMDEVKRALEAAEQIAFTAVTLHLGQKGDAWGPWALEHSLTAIEHIKAFAHPLGVKVLLENLPNEVATPEHLLEIVRVGHFDTVGFCLDVGHAHLAGAAENSGVDAAFAAFGSRIAELNLHTSANDRDEHRWPEPATSEKGSIDWASLTQRSKETLGDVPMILEPSYEHTDCPSSVTARLQAFQDGLRRASDKPSEEPQH